VEVAVERNLQVGNLAAALLHDVLDLPAELLLLVFIGCLALQVDEAISRLPG